MTKAKKKVAKKPVKKIAKKKVVLSKLSKAEVRVLICKDVIKHVKAKRLQTTAGTYFSLYNSKPIFQMDNQINAQWRKASSCNVCALGGLFISAVDRFDKLKFSDLSSTEFYQNSAFRSVDAEPEDIQRYLKRWFTKPQMERIESAFEGRQFINSPFGTYNPNNYFTKRFRKKPERLIAIMKHIIKDKGEVNLPVEKPKAFNRV